MIPQITFKEGSRYLLEHSVFNRTILECSFVEDNTVWLISKPSNNVALIDCVYYKLNRKSGKLYRLNEVFSSYDLVEGYTLTAYGSNDAVGQTSYESYRVI